MNKFDSMGVKNFLQNFIPNDDEYRAVYEFVNGKFVLLIEFLL